MSTRNTRSTGSNPENQTPDIAQLLAQQIQDTIPSIVTQVTADINNRQRSNGDQGSDGSGDGNQGCTYKTFMSCKPKEFYGNEGAVGLLAWFDSMESVLHISKCSENRKVEYAACQLQGMTLTWWNIQLRTRGREAAYNLTWEDFKKLLIEEYCSKSETQKWEAEFWNHTMVGMEVDKYTERFHELAKLVPHMVTPEEKRIDRYIWGLALEIRGMVTLANPTTIQNAVVLANRLTNDVVRAGALNQGSVSYKRKSKDHAEEDASGASINRRKVAKRSGRYVGPHPQCNKCNLHHVGDCPICNNYNKPGHISRFCRMNKDGRKICYNCGSPDHLRDKCPKLNRRDDAYTIEITNGQEIKARDVTPDCTLANKLFSIDLIPIKIGSFGIVVVSMDWLSRKGVEIKTLIIQRERPETSLKVVSCMTVDRHLKNKCLAFLVQVDNEIRDIQVVWNYPEVLPNELSRPPQVEFQIYLIPGAAPVVKAPYHLATTDTIYWIRDLFSQALRFRERISCSLRINMDLLGYRASCISKIDLPSINEEYISERVLRTRYGHYNFFCYFLRA
ncbi:hypothetical protein OSB04_023747 [Centaurea solstitialis]|uniref:CCHC-type domain-containing protein n=1 Tax=Centaurea solstitialis TaxID=347529 RepID=A0AA38W9Q8_9ASTR|nr:hypothetical protein OSB04_023747 [Centaurea solstitialis]